MAPLACPRQRTVLRVAQLRPGAKAAVASLQSVALAGAELGVVQFEQAGARQRLRAAGVDGRYLEAQTHLQRMTSR